ncbi:fumarylacetoacetate hydrolase family protein [Pseudoprimorskyibacter insulae]|uniref:Ureidoglycolate lyase n=1 Tax=Pseudoprimorskyibacter insulae TaxID=1695997 RepID=A0A2R8APZ4_9RHOB|nr:fumarylacetoacetate hydrolase family protein [Pseudoprimorskyibacter insulae]SPF78158.1 Ureidoglycolate lyase [Pseudoprimorskyibacter insulae]
MKFATLRQGDTLCFGLVDGDRIHLAPEGDTLRAHLGGDLAALAARLRDVPAVSLAGADYAPVVPDPQQILCIGLNYRDHREETRPETRKSYPETPVVFPRFATSLAGHGEALPKPHNETVMDYEAELAVIIGKGGRYIAKENAMGHIAGYACFNDISMRTWQTKSEQWGPGKNFPKSGPLGPVMVTADAVPDITEAGIRLYLDGELMQESWIKHLLFDLPTLIAHCSQFVELRPGDVIATGTPGGVGFARRPMVLLEPGKTVVVEIDGVGRLENAIVAE